MKILKVKTILTIILAVVMLLSTACGAQSTTTENNTSTTENLDVPEPETKVEGEPVQLLYATHSVGSATYTISAGLGTLWGSYLPEGSFVDVQPISPGGMGAAYLFESGNADIAFVNGAPAKWAFEKGTLGKQPVQGYRGLVGSLTEVSAISFFTQSFIDKYGVDTLEEVIEKKIPIRIGCSPKGSMDEHVVEMALNYLGATYDDIKSWGGDVVHAAGSELSGMVRDGKLDMMLDHTSVQSSTMTEISMTSDVQFIQWGDDLLDYFVSEGFERIEMPANSWKGQDKAIINAGTPDSIYVSEDMPDEVAYALTKAMAENRDFLIKQYASLKNFNPEVSWKQEKLGGIPLHPGAEKYYREAGYMK